jgi:hypothetical protein
VKKKKAPKIIQITASNGIIYCLTSEGQLWELGFDSITGAACWDELALPYGLEDSK